MLKSLLAAILALALGGCASSGGQAERARMIKAAEYNAQLGAGYMARGNLEQAKIKFEKALEQDASNPNANSGYALLQARLGNDQEATRYFDKAIALDPTDSEVLNNYGAYLCTRGEHAEAERRFLAAARNALYKTPEYAYRNAGTCAQEAGDLPKAVQYFKRALESNPRFSPALLDLVRVNLEARRHAEASGYLERYHGLFPQSAESLWLGVRLHRDTGDLGQADDFAARLSKLFPQSAQARKLNESRLQ